MYTIPLKLLGYNKQHVDEFLEKVREAQENEISLFKENIEACKLEKDLLDKELKALLEEKKRYSATAGLLEYALDRIKNTVFLIDKACDIDLNNINDNLLRKITIHDNYAVDIEKEIKQTRLRLDAMLQSILEFSREKEASGSADEESATRKVVGTIFSSASKSEIVSAMGEDIAGKTVVGPNGAIIGRVGDLLRDSVTIESRGFYLRDGRFVPAEYVMAVKKDSLVVSADWQKGLQQAEKTDSEKLENKKALIEKHITADGISVHKGEPVEETTGHKENTIENTPQVGGIRELYESAPDDGDNAGDFWGAGFDNNVGYDHIVEEKSEPQESFMLVSREAMEESFFTGESEEASTSEQAFIYEETQGMPETTSAPSGKKEPVRNYLAGPQQLVADKASPAVAKEIKNIRHKYVVGKLAGEDLLDNEGLVIIRKTGMITPEIVERAEKEGKLAELIINMVIPGLEQ